MKGFVKRNARELILVLVIVVLIALFSAVSDSFFAVGTLMNFLRQNVVLLIASLGMLLCMLTGGLDLSVGATGGIAAMCAALTMQAVGGEGFATALVGFVVATAVGCLGDFEYQRFGNSTSGDENGDTSKYFECDLLIIDDLGTEVNNQFTTSVLYNIINTRLSRRLSTIISTNLTQDEFRRRYWDRITSRVLGEYTVLPFVGVDIRAQKLK